MDVTRDVAGTGSPAAARPFDRRAVCPTAAHMTRIVCDGRFADYLRALHGITQWRAGPCSVSAQAARWRDPGAIVFALAPDGGRTPLRFCVGLDLHDYPALSIVAWPERGAMTEHPSGDTALRQAVAGVVLAPLLACLASSGYAGAQVVEVRRGAADAVWPVSPLPGLAAACEGVPAQMGEPPLTMLALSFVREAQRYEIAVAAVQALPPLPDRFLQALTGARVGGPAAGGGRHGAPVPAYAQLAVPGRLIIGMKRLAVSTLDALEPGDVLLRAVFPSLDAGLLDADNGSGARERRGAVAAWGTPGLSRLYVRVETGDLSLVITRKIGMSKNLEASAADAGLAVDEAGDPVPIGELELPVQFEIDTVALSLSQLSVLGPGYVLELPESVAQAQLRLVVHGQTVGYGELVTVGEHLGIRIIRMAHDHEHEQQ